MAWDNTAYATAAEYRTRNGRVSSDLDSTLNEMLLSVSRVVDRRVGVAPAQFAPQTTVELTFASTGGRLLRLRDEQGRQHFLRTSTAIAIDSERDGTFDGYTSIVLGTDAWVKGYPRNALSYGEPYQSLELLPGVASASPGSWPVCDVKITGNWGWAAIPGGITDRVIGITRELVQVHYGGPVVDDVINAAIEASMGARSLMNLLEQEYRYRLAAFA